MMATFGAAVQGAYAAASFQRRWAAAVRFESVAGQAHPVEHRRGHQQMVEQLEHHLSARPADGWVAVGQHAYFPGLVLAAGRSCLVEGQAVAHTHAPLVVAAPSFLSEAASAAGFPQAVQQAIPQKIRQQVQHVPQQVPQEVLQDPPQDVPRDCPQEVRQGVRQGVPQGEVLRVVGRAAAVVQRLAALPALVAELAHWLAAHGEGVHGSHQLALRLMFLSLALSPLHAQGEGQF